MKSVWTLVCFLIQFLFQQEAFGQKLKTGELAPGFEITDTKAELIKLEHYKGQKVFLAFFRYAGCPVCNARMHELLENYERISAQGYKIIAVFESESALLKEYLLETPVPFVVVGDPELTLYKKYKVEKSFWRMFASAFKKQPRTAMKKGNKLFSKKYRRDGNLTRLPADFLLDEMGIIKVVHYGENIGDHLPLTEILNNK